MKTKPTKSPIIQFIAKNIRKMDSEEFYTEAYRRFKVTKPNMRHYVWRYRRKNGIEDNWSTKPGQQSVSDSLSKKASKNQSIDALVDQFDIVKRLKKAIKSIPPGSFLTDEQMRRLAGISHENWTAAFQHPSCSPNRLMLPNRKNVWMSVRDKSSFLAKLAP